MPGPGLTCADPRRRADARAHGLNGIDAITVSDDQRTRGVAAWRQGVARTLNLVESESEPEPEPVPGGAV